MPTKIELAYCAGVMDSDGSFSISIDTWRQRKLGRTPAYQELAAIGQCDLQAIELLHELFGGSIRREQSRGVYRRPVNYWQVGNLKAVNAARLMLPYLRIKRRQAELLLALREIKDRGRIANTELVRPKVRVLRASVVAEMDDLARQVRECNDSRRPLSLSKEHHVAV